MWRSWFDEFFYKNFLKGNDAIAKEVIDIDEMAWPNKFFRDLKMAQKSFIESKMR